MRAHPPNTSRRALVALAGLVAVLAAAGLAACGASGSPSAQTLLSQTFESHKPIESGRLDLSLALSPAGSGGALSSSEAFALRLRGPFQSLGPARLPRFALQLSLRAAGLTLQAGATSTAGKFFIELAGKPFLAPASTVAALQNGYAQATRASTPAQRRSTFGALGLDPTRWLVHPTLAGTATVAGAETVHIVAGLNASRFLADAERLSGAGGTLGLGAGGPGALFSAARLSALSSSVRSARVDVYAGAHDHLLRRLSLSATLSTTSQARAALGALRGASITLVLQFAGLNQPQAIPAPSNPQPISQLGPALQRLGLVPGG